MGTSESRDVLASRESRQVTFKKGAKGCDYRQMADWQEEPTAENAANAVEDQRDEADIAVIQFGSPVLIADEGEKLEIRVMRLGSLTGRINCKYRTVDGSGKAGSRYEATSGEIVFEDSEYLKFIRVTVLDLAYWSPTQEFKVELTNPCNCILGRVLCVCRVRVADQNFFPSDEFADLIIEGEDLPVFRSFLSYMRLVCALPGNRWRVFLILCFDQLKNLYTFFLLKVSVYMVDVIFAKDEEEKGQLLVRGNPEKTALIVGVVYFTLPLILHIWELAKMQLDLKNRVEVYVQQCLVRKYLNYSEESRKQVSNAKMLKLVTTDCAELAGGFMDALDMVRTLGKLAMLNYFILSTNPESVWCVILMPVIMLVWSGIRDGCLEGPESPGKAKRELSQLIIEICNKFRLVSLYAQRPHTNDLFYAQAEKVNEIEVPKDIYDANTAFLFDWLGPLFVGGYIALMSPAVLSGTLPLGDFLGTINVFKEVSSNFSDGYNQLKKVLDCHDPLMDVVVFLNRSTGLSAMKVTEEARARYTDDIRAYAQSLADTSDGKPKCDIMPLELRNVSFRYNESSDWLFNEVSITIEQGLLIGVFGESRSGKSSLMSLLAYEMPPTFGDVFIPAHLRTIHVTQEVMLTSQSALSNLIFGCEKHTGDADPSRVRHVLNLLDMQEIRKLVEEEWDVSEPTDSDEDVPCGLCCGSKNEKPGRQSTIAPLGYWDRISYTERSKVHIARALIANPEVLVMSKPLSHFDTPDQTKILDALRQQVDHRGIALPIERIDTRRPRTCICTADSMLIQGRADVLWKIEAGKILIL